MVSKLDKKYVGAFSVEIYEGASTDFLRQLPVTLSGKIITVTDGAAYQSLGGIQLEAHGKPFIYGYKSLKRITAANGEVLLGKLE